jgi:hypothetical protein
MKAAGRSHLHPCPLFPHRKKSPFDPGDQYGSLYVRKEAWNCKQGAFRTRRVTFTYSPPALADARPEAASPERAEGREAVRALPRYSVELRGRNPRSTRPARGLSRAALAGTRCVCPRAGHAQRLTPRQPPALPIFQRQVEPGPHGSFPLTRAIAVAYSPNWGAQAGGHFCSTVARFLRVSRKRLFPCTTLTQIVHKVYNEVHEDKHRAG